MSLYSLGIGHSPLSPLRRQFTASTSSALQIANADADDELSDPVRPNEEASDQQESSSEDADFADDSKEVLMDRLNDLLHRLAVGGSIKGDNVSSLHAKVDEMEKVLASDHSKPARPWSVRQQPSLMRLASPLPVLRRDSLTNGLDSRFNHWSLPATPTQPPSQRSIELSGPVTAQKESFVEEPRDSGNKDPTTNDEDQDIDGPKELARRESDNDSSLDHQLLPQAQSDNDEVETSSNIAEEVLFAAQKLCDELNHVLQDLQDRKQESDHLHAMLIDRAEGAARRIMELDDLVLSLEEEVAANKSDLEHLRLQLRAVEVLVPDDADRDLLQSIENWKADYSKLKTKMAAKRRERRGDGDGSSVGLGSPSPSMLIERAGLLR